MIQEKRTIFGFSHTENMAKFEPFHFDNFIKHKPLISQEYLLRLGVLYHINDNIIWQQQSKLFTF